MLKKFEVTGFKNFKEHMILDFSDIKQYNFNKFCIKNDLLKTGIIYGKNAIGKSNFGLALFDITTHIVDKNLGTDLYDHYLTNDGETLFAEFCYTFQFNSNEVVYSYQKSDVKTLLQEKLIINNIEIFNLNSSDNLIDNLKVNENYSSLFPNLHYHDKNTSFLRYSVLNTREKDTYIIPTLINLFDFISNMLWFRSLGENRFIGYKDRIKKANDYLTFIFESNNLFDFQKLLNNVGIETQLIAIETPENKNELYFKGNPNMPFFKVASNGTRALYTYFYWTRNKDISFLFIDEFDAYYHFELAELIVKDLENKNYQTILTTHNTNLLSNSIMRPDCYFILSATGLTSIAKSTNRELREGHNLEKLYINGEFGGN